MKPKNPKSTLWSRSAGIAITITFAVTQTGSLHAADSAWDAGGGANTNYNTAINWNPDGVPTGAANNALIDTGNVTITSDIPAIGVLEIGRGANPLAQLVHTAGVVTTSAGFGIGFYGTATYNLSGTGSGNIAGDLNVGFGAGNGTATLNSSNTLSANFIGIANGTFNDTADHPVGMLNLNGGTLSSNNGFFMAGTTASTASVTQAGGTLNVGGELWVANRGTGTFTQSQGTLNTNQWLVLSRFGAAKGTFNLTGGTVNAAQVGGNVAMISEGGVGATATLNVSGGIFNVGDTDTEADLWITEIYGGGGGTGTATVSGTGTVNVSNEVWFTKNASGTATLNLDGGILQTEKIVKGAGNGTLNFNGGILRPTAGTPEFLTASRINVRNGGAIIDTDWSVGIAQPFLHSNISGDNATDGGITKNGSGDLTIAGASTYTGPTVVNGGGLVMSGAGSSPVTVNSGKFDGVGSFGALTVTNEGGNVIANGNGGTGSLTVSSLTFETDSYVSVRKGASTPIVVSGTLKTTPANGLVYIDLLGSYPNGLVNLIQFGTLNGNINHFAVNNAPNLSVRQSVGSLQLNGNYIAANIVGEGSLVWTGLGNSTWQAAEFGDETGPHNWATKSGHTGTNFWAGDNAEFNDTYNIGAGDVPVTQTTVNITGASVTPGTATFNNSSVNYTLTTSDGSGIEGAAVIKNGTGKVTILNLNNSLASTTINAGTIELGNGISDGNITSGTIVNNGTLTYNWAGNRDVTNVISGSGTLTKTGAGQLRITSANPFTGAVNVNGGTLFADAGNGPTDRNFSYVSGISVNNGSTLSSTPNSLFGWDGSQAKPITINTGGTAIAIDSDVNVGLVTLNGGTLASANIAEANSGWGSWNFARGVATKKLLVTENSIVSAIQVGFRNGATIEVAAAKTLAFTGTITNSNDGISTVIKEGAGTLTFSGANTYTGNTTVNAGILSVTNNSATTFADTSTLTLASGAKLNLPNNTTDLVAALVVNGTTLPAGTYGSASPATSAYITGSGQIQVAGTGGYSTWAAANVGGDAANVDTDLDGVRNGIEYFMNAPAGFTVSPGPNGANTVTWVNGGNVPASAYGTQFVVQTSPDLVTWTDVPVGSLVTNTDGPGGSLTYTITGSGKQFVRLSVNPQ